MGPLSGMGLIHFRIALIAIQRNVRKFLQLRFWGWWKLYTKVKPMVLQRCVLIMGFSGELVICALSG